MESNERLLSIKHGNNFRDLGGYQTNDGKTVKWHKLIRSGHLHELDQSDLTTLQKLNVAVDIDFRAPMEAKLQPDKVPSNAAYHRLSVFETDKTDASHSQEEIQREYSNNPGAGFNHMVDVYQENQNGNRPLPFGCARRERVPFRRFLGDSGCTHWPSHGRMSGNHVW